MSALHSLISDLALILILAGITTLLFKWLKQPVVLGYIVAGFLASPHFGFTPTVTDAADIHIWAEIGIIVLLFSLGLEFNIKKLATIGGSALTTTAVIVFGMMGIGYGAGMLLRFSASDSLFLAAMLSMSSTTIIIKAFTDLGLRKQKFTTLVFGVLVLEDVVAVLLMVILTSVAVNKEFEGSALAFSFFKLVFFLVIWFTLGVFLIPTFLQRMRRYLNSETLLIVSMGLCLGMVVLASYVGFSSALGAFIMGSILAGTVQAERIEKVIRPVKDLFGAVFFISVGMLVDPAVLVQYTVPILVLSVVVIVGQILFATTGMLLSGQPLKTAVQSGFSLAQIGEFAFIIAALGMSLKVIDGFIYPVVVAVSVVTTFTTPYFIRMAGPFGNWLENRLPAGIRSRLERYDERLQRDDSRDAWKRALTLFAGKVLLYAIVTSGIIALSLHYLIPFVRHDIESPWGVHAAVFVTVLVMMPLLWAMSLKSQKNSHLYALWNDKKRSQWPLLLFVALRFLLALGLLSYFLTHVYSLHMGLLISLFTFALFMLLFNKKIQSGALLLESTFLDNLNERELRKTGARNNVVHTIHLAQMNVFASCPFIGERLADADINRKYGVNIVSIRRDKRRINLPGGEMRIFPKDVLSVVGTNDQLVQFLKAVEPDEEPLDDDSVQTAVDSLELEKLPVPADSPLLGKMLKETSIRRKGCLVVGIERADGSFDEPGASVIIRPGDQIWLVGEKQVIEKLL